jgi:hypothetical protein
LPLYSSLPSRVFYLFLS